MKFYFWSKKVRRLLHEEYYAKLLLLTSLVDRLDFAIVKEVISFGEGLRSAAGDPESNYFVAPVLAKLGTDCAAEKKAVLSGFAS